MVSWKSKKWKSIVVGVVQKKYWLVSCKCRCRTIAWRCQQLNLVETLYFDSILRNDLVPKANEFDTTQQVNPLDAPDISTNGNINAPLRSCNLTPLDKFDSGSWYFVIVLENIFVKTIVPVFLCGIIHEKNKASVENGIFFESHKSDLCKHCTMNS